MHKTLIMMTAGVFLVGAAMVAAQPPEHAGDAFRRACENGRIDSDRCDAASETDRPAAQARRAAHHAHAAWEGIQNAVFRLELVEFRARAALDDDNLTPEQEANLTARIERIQNAQDTLIERALALRERVEGLKERWSEVREDMDGREPVLICHVGEGGEATTLRLPLPAAHAHIREHADDHRGACAGDDAGDADDAADGADTGDADGSEDESEDESEDDSDE
jgi:hypothetical protein